MKNFAKLILLVVLVTIISSCDHDVKIESSYCDVSTNTKVENELGRIYFYDNEFNTEQNKFYYIGNPDTLKRNGGFIPCGTLSEDLIPNGSVGELVIYSGAVKLQRNAEEPLYFGIELSSIRKER